MADPRQELLTEYTEVNQNFRMLADIRFKLLALIPTLGGVAIFLLSRMQQSDPDIGYGLLLLISCLGFLATLGITLYDQRNSELYNALISRAKILEKELEIHGGQFAKRPGRSRYLFTFVQLGHDSGLALIYGAVLGAWFYPLTSAFLGLTPGWAGLPPETRHGLSLTLAAIMVALFVLELLRLDGTSVRELLRFNRRAFLQWPEVFGAEILSNEQRVRQRTISNEGNIEEHTLCFRGKAIARHKEGNSNFTLYACPKGYRVYVERGGGTTRLHPTQYNPEGRVEYEPYPTKEELVEEFPVERFSGFRAALVHDQATFCGTVKCS